MRSEMTADAVQRSAQHLLANLLRVARGAGNPGAMRRDAQDFIDALDGFDGDSITEAVDGLSAWREYIESVPDGRLQAVLGAMQIVASALIGQNAQVSSGERQMDLGLRIMHGPKTTPDAFVPDVHQWRPDNDNKLVYFITDGAAIKIGVSANPQLRLAGLQTSHHAALTILGTTPGGFGLETALHKEFSADRLREDGEWFADTKRLRDRIEELTGGSGARDGVAA